MATRRATGNYGGATADARRADRRRRLLDAALDRLGDGGWQAASVRGICAQSQLNPRYFYESFAGLDELLVALFDEIVAETMARIADGVADAPDTLDGHARAIASGFLAIGDHRKARVGFVEALGSAALMRRRLDTMQRTAELIAAMARRFRPELDEAAATVRGQMLAGGLVQASIARVEGRLDDVPTERLVDECAAVMVATLRGEDCGRSPQS